MITEHDHGYSYGARQGALIQWRGSIGGLNGGVYMEEYKSNCVAATHLKGWDMLRAARPHARFYGIQKSSSLYFPDPIFYLQD